MIVLLSMHKDNLGIKRIINTTVLTIFAKSAYINQLDAHYGEIASDYTFCRRSTNEPGHSY